MFDTVEIIMDKFGHPIFILPEEPTGKEYSVTVEDDSLEFFSDSEKVGSVEIEEMVVLELVSQQEKVGIIVWDDEKTEECPKNITHVAPVTDKRNFAE